MQNAMSALGILVVTAACSGPASPEPRPVTPQAAPIESAPVVDACAADAARLQPSLDANLALFDKWGFPPEVVETMDLANVSTELDRVPPGLPVVTVTPTQIELFREARSPGSIRSRLDALGARDIVLAIENQTLWPAVVRLLHALPAGMRVYIAFSVDSPTNHVGDPAVVRQLRDGGLAAFRDRGRDMAKRCPAVGELFMARTEEIVGVFARDAGAALRGCRCAVSASELSNVYEALIVRGYVAGRSVKMGRAGVSVGGGKSTTFKDVARTFAALPADAEVSADVDR